MTRPTMLRRLFLPDPWLWTTIGVMLPLVDKIPNARVLCLNLCAPTPHVWWI